MQKIPIEIYRKYYSNDDWVCGNIPERVPGTTHLISIKAVMPNGEIKKTKSIWIRPSGLKTTYNELLRLLNPKAKWDLKLQKLNEERKACKWWQFAKKAKIDKMIYEVSFASWQDSLPDFMGKTNDNPPKPVSYKSGLI